MPQLTARTCLCGCKKAFRVHDDNRLNYFFSKSHAEWSKQRRDAVGLAARKFLMTCIGRNGEAPRIKRQQRARVTKSCRE